MELLQRFDKETSSKNITVDQARTWDNNIKMGLMDMGYEDGTWTQ
jgi:hypothetical protein